MTKAHNIDCMEYMAELPDNAFDLAVVDTPYGIDIGNDNLTNIKHEKKDWDKDPPPLEYFTELFRVSKYQIIWGGNYFTLPISKSWICWDKVNPMKKKRGDFELAWTSFSFQSLLFRMPWIGYARIWKEKDKPIHSTQKPIALYKWILTNYAQPGWKILDTHLGSGSSRIAAHDLGFDFVGCELDKEYFEAQEDRYKNHISQGELFQAEEYQDIIYEHIELEGMK